MSQKLQKRRPVTDLKREAEKRADLLVTSDQLELTAIQTRETELEVTRSKYLQKKFKKPYRLFSRNKLGLAKDLPIDQALKTLEGICEIASLDEPVEMTGTITLGTWDKEARFQQYRRKSSAEPKNQIDLTDSELSDKINASLKYDESRKTTNYNLFAEIKTPTHDLTVIAKKLKNFEQNLEEPILAAAGLATMGSFIGGIVIDPAIFTGIPLVGGPLFYTFVRKCTANESLAMQIRVTPKPADEIQYTQAHFDAMLDMHKSLKQYKIR
tara:strand:- start:23 stop:829 length:807 start_codon:yes stop_codon:yes gene_type:complete